MNLTHTISIQRIQKPDSIESLKKEICDWFKHAAQLCHFCSEDDEAEAFLKSKILLPFKEEREKQHCFDIKKDQLTTIGRAWMSEGMNNKELRLAYITIDKHFRKNGYAEKAIYLLEKYAIENGFTKITLNVFGHLFYAKKMYLKIGFQIVKEFENNGILITSEMEKTLLKQNLMSLEEERELLVGGRVTKNVVRIGETVRRSLSKNSSFVHQLLQHLEEVGFYGAPKFLGIDELDREILSYIAGYVPPNLNDWEDQQLIAAAKLIRHYHDATISFEPKKGEEIICHNDLSPCNAVMIEGIPIALIDFDAAAPGSRASDLAYAVWMWCTLGEEEISPNEQARRIKLMLDAYGFEERRDFISEIIEVQKKQIQKFKLNVEQGLIHWNDAVNWTNKCMRWIEMHRNELERNI